MEGISFVFFALVMFLGFIVIPEAVDSAKGLSH